MYNKVLGRETYFYLYCYKDLKSHTRSSFEVGSHLDIIFTFGIVLNQNAINFIMKMKYL